MPFRPVTSTLDPPALEAAVQERWDRDEVFAASLRNRVGAPEWVFYEGPPTANGRPGIHHVWARLFKDLYPRFHTMRGRHVARKGGWDCHGLPVEVEVEKSLGFTGKPQIEAYGIEAFNALCRASVTRYVEDFRTLSRRIGMWIDIDDAYWTMSNPFIESVWWTFGRLWDRGLIYEGSKVVPYCGRCGTALSSHELGQPGAYQDVTEESVYVRFPIVGQDFDLVVWTTTPWTLPANVAAAVGPTLEYVRVADPSGGRDLVMARSRVEAVLGSDATIIAAVAPTELEGLHYDRPFVELPIDADANRVVIADFVTADDGSGIVHLAPAFGEIDREVAEAHGLPMLNPVDATAAFDPTFPPGAGRFVKDADPDLVDALRHAGRLLATEGYTHSYPHCWRCATPLIYWAKPTWFACTEENKDRLLEENERIGWHPETIRHGRFGDWLENNVDWALSRDRFWGTPIPVWRCSASHDHCITSVEELSTRSGRNLSDLDLHRPAVDEVVIPCPQCGVESRRVEPVLDAWFDSGSMPAAQFHYPFENQELFASRFPADFICEAIDQTRGWFYSLLAVNTLVFEKSPYRNVVCLALVVDKDGQKMSKSKGNVIDPYTVLDTRGADALRWNMFSAGSPWTPKRVFVEAIDESTRRFLLTLWNTYSFFVTYANLDSWSPASEPTRSGHVLDRWVRSRVHATAQVVTDALEDFDALRGAQALESLVDDLSNWYVRRSRSRFWKSSDTHAHATLHESLVMISRLLAPYCPFLSDEIHANLTGDGVSVHLTDWPEFDPAAIDPDLEAAMDRARTAVSLGRNARTESKLRVRQPLRRALVLLPDGATLPAEVAAEVAAELNVRTLETVTNLDGLLDYSVQPNFRTLGPKVGAIMPDVKRALAASDGSEVRANLERDGVHRLAIGGREVTLTAEDVVVRAVSHDRYALARDADSAVALDTELDDDLRAEGTARELIRALNDQRKTIGLDLSDRIEVSLFAPGLESAIEAHSDSIATEILARSFLVVAEEPEGVHFEIDGVAVTARIERTAT